MVYGRHVLCIGHFFASIGGMNSGKKALADTFAGLNDKQKKFCEALIRGMTNIDAMEYAGYVKPNHDLKEIKWRQYYSARACAIKKGKAIQKVLKESGGTYISKAVDVRPDDVLTVLMDITLSRITFTKVDNKGNEHEIPPDAQDRISASLAMLAWVKYIDKKNEGVVDTIKIDDGEMNDSIVKKRILT